MSIWLLADESIHILVQDQQLLKKSVLKLTPTLPPHIPPQSSFWDSTGSMSMGGEGRGRFSLLRRITSSQIPIHPHKDRLMFPPHPSNYSPVLKYSLFMGTSSLFLIAFPIRAAGVLYFYWHIWTLIDSAGTMSWYPIFRLSYSKSKRWGGEVFISQSLITFADKGERGLRFNPAWVGWLVGLTAWCKQKGLNVVIKLCLNRVPIREPSPLCECSQVKQPFFVIWKQLKADFSKCSQVNQSFFVISKQLKCPTRAVSSKNNIWDANEK